MVQYMTVCIDNLMFAMDDPITFEKLLHEHYNIKLKGTGETDNYHIDMDFLQLGYQSNQY